MWILIAQQSPGQIETSIGATHVGSSFGYMIYEERSSNDDGERRTDRLGRIIDESALFGPDLKGLHDA